MRTIRASEFGSYLYCKRSWWYHQQGIESQNQAELQSGEQYHLQHAGRVQAAGVLRFVGWALLLAAAGVLAAALALQWTG